MTAINNVKFPPHDSRYSEGGLVYTPSPDLADVIEVELAEDAQEEHKLARWEKLGLVDVMLKQLLKSDMTCVQQEQMVEDIFEIITKIEEKLCN